MYHQRKICTLKLLCKIIVFIFLEFEIKKPMQTFTGSITDKDLVERACHGVDIVLHVASIIDYNQFPNQAILNEVNVKGSLQL